MFVKFKNLIENLLCQTIKRLQLDNGGEFIALGEFFRQHGITHHRAYPSAHQKMGAVEHRHHHVVDSGLALLNHARLPFSFWQYAFNAAVFTYNRTSTTSLARINPFEKLFR